MFFSKPPLIVNLVDNYIMFEFVEFGLTPFVRRLGVVPYDNVRVYKYSSQLGAVYILGDLMKDGVLDIKFVYFTNEQVDIMKEVKSIEELKEHLLLSVLAGISNFNIFSNN